MKGKGIRARDRAWEEGGREFLSFLPRPPKFPRPLLTPATTVNVCMVGSTKFSPPPTIQTSVNIRNFAELYFRSLNPLNPKIKI